jgi:hypothetical protein
MLKTCRFYNIIFPFFNLQILDVEGNFFGLLPRRLAIEHGLETYKVRKNSIYVINIVLLFEEGNMEIETVAEPQSSNKILHNVSISRLHNLQIFN